MPETECPTLTASAGRGRIPTPSPSAPRRPSTLPGWPGLGCGMRSPRLTARPRGWRNERRPTRGRYTAEQTPAGQDAPDEAGPVHRTVSPRPEGEARVGIQPEVGEVSLRMTYWRAA